MADAFPSMMRPLIHERDEYMVATLAARRPAPASATWSPSSAGHCDGIEARWNDARADPVELERMLETTKGWRWVRTCG